ncbi:LCP family protein [Pseudonocardia sp. H11422]|uniref:LCP family glycopolymer transferase n=1 Tax=Pseudonocardia sp. H11422 TaxID=2835866 RepID=UPI001BDC3A7C|nr:LCP family protein [Pseudonocardia sp. H11422]
MTALAFDRQRHGLTDGDLDRVIRQQAYMAGLTHRIMTAGLSATRPPCSGSSRS